LQAERHIVAASLYDQNGKPFAKYPAHASATDFPTAPEGEGYRFARSHLTAFQPVVQGSERFGTLYLKSDMTAMYERFRLYGSIAVLVIAGSSLVAYMLSRKLQQQISRPILALAKTAKAISDGQDYSVRATKHSQDELGLLTDAFNLMLTQIHGQDQALRASEERLRLLLSATHQAVWDWDIAADRLWHQEDLRLGIEGALSSGKGAAARWLERVHPADRERVTQSLKALLADTGEIWSQEYR
ncbi:MAG: HAMP domain-containing protein, partial [Gammaproteobacteria bacterium]